jgi:diketogulonate reductase-like aldo/keto reductase
MSAQHYVALNDGTQVPWLAFGTGTALYDRDAAALVEQAINTGIVHLDGAQAYSNEETLGAGIKASGKPRSELYIVTKLKTATPIQDIKPSIHASLKKLGTDYVDLFLVHSPIGYDVRGTLSAVWKTMEEIKSEGLAKSIGVSNYRLEDLKITLESAKVVPAVNQVSISPMLCNRISNDMCYR